MKLIVGLGNKGKEYENTRHNTGFIFLDDYLKERKPIWKEKFKGLYYEEIIQGEKVIFLKPQTYMNNSGEAVILFANFYKIKAEDILIISDDLDQKIGKFRLRSHGSSGGHNGLKSIEENLKTDKYNRLRIGISTERKEQIDTVSYVLGTFSKEEQKELIELKPKIHKVLDDYFILSFEELMSKYNQRK